MSLSAIIPTRNEETFLKNCLKSVKFADEIIVIDSGSTDKTIEIAKEFGAKIVNEPWQGFRHVHNLAPKHASGDWLLYIDADERVSKKLRLQIQTTLKNPTASAYQIPRKNFFFGKPMKHGGWYPDHVTRLIHKDKLIDWVGELHEYPQIDGPTHTLSAPIYHLTHRGIAWSLQKTTSYTHQYATLLFKSDHPPVRVRNFFGAMAREFYFRAIKKSGWRDGFVGWLEIIYQTFNAFLIQVWLWEMQQSHTQTETYRRLDEKLSKKL